jgi:isochorismate synthase
LFIPEETHRDDSAMLQVPVRALAVGPLREAQFVPTRDRYQQAVRGALDAMRIAGDRPLDKVVLARTLRLVFAEPIDIARVFENLRSDPAATAFQVTRGDGDTVFIGGSPELLVERFGDRVTSLPMAGSVPRAPVSSVDTNAASRLLRSFKDQREHQFVVESVLDALAPFCRELKAPPTPELTSTTTMWHLATPVVGRLRRDVSSLELALALHPTPAVCGTPRLLANDTITTLEPFDRGLFAGTVGWCDRRGDGQWMVSIRCAEIRGVVARLFAGAGIVPESDPSAEADETEAKFGTFLRALGVALGDALAAESQPAAS